MKNEWSNIAGKASKIQGTKNDVLNPILVSLIEKYANGKKLFDYGCGWGEFANIMQERGFNVTAFDEADEMVSQAKNKFTAPVFLYKNDFESELPKMEEMFDVVTSNLVLCILEKSAQEKLLCNIKLLVKEKGLLIVSFCHPKYDYLPDSLVSRRFVPENAKYTEEFMYEKEIKENEIKFTDYHRPLEYYTSLFEKFGLKILETKESDILGTDYKPDFIVFALQR